jgi:trk system potassium uptake protein TrkH
MRLHVILRYVAITFLLNAFFLLISGLISLAAGESSSFPLFYGCLVAALFGIFPLIFIPPPSRISNNEGLLIVVYSWLSSCLIGLIPYVLWGGEFTFTNGWFESVSGYTTTGSSILKNIEALPLGLLFWRSSTHWIGGIGIIIFALAVLPHMGFLGMVLYRSEMAPPALQDFNLNAKKSLRILLIVYLGLTGLETLALILCKLSLFDAITTAFATIATGGFSPRNASIAYYQSLPVEIVVIVFMVLSGIHFGLLYSTVYSDYRSFWKSPIVKFYLFFLASGVCIATLNIHGTVFSNLSDSLRYAAFQVISIGTSTGFATTDSSIWPSLSQLILIFFTLQCACAGSTSGGIKVDRILIFFKSIARRTKQVIHPHGVFLMKLGGNPVEEIYASSSVLYISFYIGIVFLSSLLLTAMGVDGLTAFSGSAATMGNVGPGLGGVGSAGNYSDIPSLGKWVLSATMLMGRLEIFALLICLNPFRLK